MTHTFDKNKFKTTTVDNVATISYDDSDSYFSAASAEDSDVSKTDLIAAAAYNAEYVLSATKAAKDIAQSTMLENKKVDKVITTLPYSTSARGAIVVSSERKRTYPGIGDRADVTKSTLSVVVKEPSTKVSKSVLKTLMSELTESLLG